jgi:hypothetical protein
MFYTIIITVCEVRELENLTTIYIEASIERKNVPYLFNQAWTERGVDGMVSYSINTL